MATRPTAERRVNPNSSGQPDSRRWRRREGRLRTLAKGQHGVVARCQLVALGFSLNVIEHRVSIGLLHTIHRGVYALGRPDLPPKGRWMAAVLACGPGAYLSHASAAALHGIRASAAARVDVTLTRPSSLTHPRIRIHRRPALIAADFTVVDGTPVTTVARTLLDLASLRFITEAHLERACEQAILAGSFDLRQVEALLRRSGGARGIRKLRAVLARGDLGEEIPASGLERRYRDLCAAAGLPAPEVNRYLLLGDEYHKVDFLWRRERVVVEVDGRRYHSTGWQRRRDARREALLREHGFCHGRVDEETIEHHATRAVATARNLLKPRRMSS
jgi:very-short-patch-repair endonuclease/predicted transcriptional regulator of viral defense system